MPEPAPVQTPDLLPEPVNQLLGALWIVFFAGRWILVKLLLAAGLLTVAQVAVLDDPILLRCYLALLCITIIVLVLRAVRGARAKSPPLSTE